jgi:large subunit ribosomal protein L3
MKFILGKKVAMTQIFDDTGAVHPVTVVDAGPVVVTQVKTETTDGYKAVQVGFGKRNPKNINKAQKGHSKDLGDFAVFREFIPSTDMKVGDKVEVGIFVEGEKVEISSISKGKGFQGVVKRHGFGGGPRTHGQKHSEREPGSIGGGLRNRVPKNMRMAGRMGGDRVTVKNLKIVKVDASNNRLYIKGAVPGRRGTLVEIRG